MAGIPTHFDWASADIIRWYDTLPNCVVAIFLPANWATQARTSCIVFTHGGGWNSSDKWREVRKAPTTLIFDDTRQDVRLLLAAGFAVAFFEWPMGWMPEVLGANQLRSPPCSRFPDISRRFAKVIQMLKTWADDKRPAYNLTGDPAHSLAIADDQYGLYSVSSGAIESAWCALQPDGAFPYFARGSAAQRYDRWMPRFSHRVGNLTLIDGVGDLRLLGTGDGASPNLMPRYGNQERYLATPALADVPLETLADSSFGPLIEADYLFNRDLPIWIGNPGSFGTGDIMNNPAMTRAQFEALAAPRTPITGVADVHETGTTIIVENALRLNEARAGRSWDQTKHRIHWGNANNNPQGLTAVPLPYVDPEQAWFDWLTNVVGMVPFR